MTNEIITQLRAYHSLGWSLIPCGSDKKPLIKWKQFQTERASWETVEDWFTNKFPGANIGVVTGAISGIVVIDIEAGGSAQGWPATVCSKTGGGGQHLFYKHPGTKVPNSEKVIAPLTDVRGDGGFAVLPPSVSHKGAYEWIIAPEAGSFAELPASILPQLLGAEDELEKVDWSAFVGSVVPEGARNSVAARYAGKLLRDTDEDQWESQAWQKLLKWNAACCKPPLPEAELRSVFGSISVREKESATKRQDLSARKSRVARLVDMVTDESSNTVLFKDEYGTAYIQLPIGNHREVWPCASSQFKRWLSGAFYEATGGREIPTKDDVATAVNHLEGRAVFRGQQHELHNRVAYIDDTIWYDLADESWRAVRITPDGWDTVTSVPLLFRRYAHLAPQVEPMRGGDLNDLFRFINITGDEQRMLFVVYLTSLFVPGWAHPALWLHGVQGSAKSTVSKVCRRLCDPSKIEIVSLTRHENDLAQQLSHHHFLFFDNVSSVSGDISDLLCRTITGSGFSKRELYTDQEDVIQYVLANVGINGINIAGDRADLLERSLPIKLERMPKSERKSEYKLLAEFEKARPYILGGIFDVVSRAMAIRPTIDPPELPRMADFAIWGSALAEAIGYGQQAFLDAYTRSLDSQSRDIVNENVVAALLLKVVSDQNEGDKWIGSPTQLHMAIMATAESERISLRQLPANPAALMREINRIKTALEDEGWQVVSKSDRTVNIRKLPTNGATEELWPDRNGQ